LLTPSVRKAGGRGVWQLYSFRDLVALRVCGTLRGEGVSLQSLRSIVRYLKQSEDSEHPLATAVLVVAGRDVWLKKNSEVALSLLHRPGQYAMPRLMEFGKLVRSLRETASTFLREEGQAVVGSAAY